MIFFSYILCPFEYADYFFTLYFILDLYVFSLVCFTYLSFPVHCVCIVFEFVFVCICICVFVYFPISPVQSILCTVPKALSWSAISGFRLLFSRKVGFSHPYKENLLPLNWEYNFHNCITFCWNPFTDFVISNLFSLFRLLALTKKS